MSGIGVSAPNLSIKVCRRYLPILPHPSHRTVTISEGYVPGVSEPKGMSDSIGWLFDWSVKQMATHSGGLSPPSWFLDRLRRLSQPGHIRLTAAQIRDRLYGVISDK